jgi:hypothetical protein
MKKIIELNTGIIIKSKNGNVKTVKSHHDLNVPSTHTIKEWELEEESKRQTHEMLRDVFKGFGIAYNSEL